MNTKNGKEIVPTENFKNEIIYRRFLLGEMTDEEREKFETEYLADEDVFDELRVVEDELVERYVSETLDFETKQKFEDQYLISEKRLQKIALTRAMLETLKLPAASAEIKKTFPAEEESSVFKSIIAYFTTPRLAFAAAAVLLVTVGCLFFFGNLKDEEIVKTATPTPTVEIETNVQTNENSTVENSITNSNRSNVERADSNSESQPTPKPTEKPPETKNVPNPVLALFAGTVRGGGKTNSVTIPKAAKGLNLQLNLESQDYKNYRAEIVDQDDKVVYKSGKITARNSKLNAFVPSEKFKTGDYLVKVYGLTATNEEESAADFSFRVNR